MPYPHIPDPPDTSSAKLVASLTCATAMGSCRPASLAMCACGAGCREAAQGLRQQGAEAVVSPTAGRAEAHAIACLKDAHSSSIRPVVEQARPWEELTLSRRLESYSLIFLRAMAASCTPQGSFGKCYEIRQQAQARGSNMESGCRTACGGGQVQDAVGGRAGSLAVRLLQGAFR